MAVDRQLGYGVGYPPHGAGQRSRSSGPCVDGRGAVARAVHCQGRSVLAPQQQRHRVRRAELRVVRAPRCTLLAAQSTGQPRAWVMSLGFGSRGCLSHHATVRPRPFSAHVVLTAHSGGSTEGRFKAAAGHWVIGFTERARDMPQRSATLSRRCESIHALTANVPNPPNPNPNPKRGQL